MLTLVEVRTAPGDLLSLALDDISDGILLAEIEGLDPVKATLVSSSFAQYDGQIYQSSRREARNIKMRLEMVPDFITKTVRDVRTRLYSFLMPKSLVSLRFYMSEGLTVDIPARVESFETALFSKEPAVDISLMCFDPDFFVPTPVTISGNTVATTAETLIAYPGTVETGIEFTLNVNRTISDVGLYMRGPDSSVRSLAFSAPLVSGDVLKINTNVGSKGATLTRAGVDSSLLYGISPQSIWLELFPGDNYFRAYVTGAAIPYTLKYTTKYGGL